MSDSHRVSLDGVWDFQLESEHEQNATPAREWRSVHVPMPWQAQFNDLRNTSGVVWYRRHFIADLLSATEHAAILHFGAVDYHATVWVNGGFVGQHEGGYLPFEFDIINFLRPGKNELLLKVIDPTDDRQIYPDFPFSEIPHGKQSWYGPISGIWQSVWLEFRPKLHLTDVQLNPTPAKASIGIRVSLSQPAQSPLQVICTATAPDGQIGGTVKLEPDLRGDIHLDASPALWSPDTPNLYTVTATLYINGNPTHSIQKTCGFRTVETRDGRITLNGAPIYLRGVLDQGYYPETIYTPPSLEFLENQARTLKSLGFNCLRIHIKVEDPRYYEVADRLGLFVWTEIPNWALLTDNAAARARQTFEGIVARDGHHPSIIAWTLINENWGTDLSRNPAHRRWLSDFYHDAKSIDPTRLIVDNSACGGNAHVASDLEDFHNYRAIPDHADEWDDWVAEFANRRVPVWYPDFAHERHDDLPLLVSEFGNWGLPDPETIQEHGAEPWWFETGFEFDNGIVYPHGVQHRFEASGLADVFPSYAEFARHAQAHMARSLHYEISTMRLYATIAGYIVTEFTDVHWECNGLLTMQRQPKHLLDPLLRDLNQDQVVVLRPVQWSGRPGTTLDVIVRTMGIDGPLKEGKVVWQADSQTGEILASKGNISLTLDKPGIVTLIARWMSEDGTPLATNQIDLACVSPELSPVRLYVLDNPALANVLRDLGYPVHEGEPAEAAPKEIVVAGHYTRALEAHIQQGGRVLLLADIPILKGDDVDIPLPTGYLAPRAGSAWQGDWANSLAWVKKQGPLAHLPGDPLLEMEWANLMPDAVLTGLPSWVLRDHSWAGLTVGWLHKTVSLLTVMPYGHGHILITTFKLNPTTLATNALAQALFAGLLNLL